jgi:hypothetical protein
MAGGCFMNHVIQVDASIGFGGDADPDKMAKSNAGQSLESLDVLVEAIDQRANYVGPVLEHILHLDRETWPGTLRE